MNGEREARLCRLMTLYERELLRMCYVYLRDLPLAEDATQETFVKAYRHLADFRGESAEKTWLMRIAINTCKDMRRAAWFRYVDRSVTPEQAPDPTEDVAAEDDALTCEVMRLPRKLMEVVLLYYYQGMTLEEIAQALGITAPSVSARLKRARDKLRIALEGGPAHEE